MNRPVIGYAGLTHLGLVHAVAAASHGFETIGFSTDRKNVENIHAGRLPVLEPNLPETLAKNHQRLTFTADPATLQRCDLVYIALDVVTDHCGQSDLGPVQAMIQTVLAHLAEGALLTVLCQVPPGFTRALPLAPARLYYQVETLVFGRALERAEHPERFILGCADPKAPLPATLKNYLEAFACPRLSMRYESAELAKIAINMCLIASVSVANLMGELCAHLGADWDEIVPALRLDKRIGPHAYLKPGLGISGGNLERDLESVRRLAGLVGSEAGTARAWIADSRYRKQWPLRELHRTVLRHTPDARLAILGLAYKENTASIKNSPALALIQHLRSFTLQAYDPAIGASQVDHPHLTGADNALAACDGMDAAIIITPWPAFARLDPAQLAQKLAAKVVIDPYRMLDPETCAQAGLQQVVLGMNNRTS